MLDVIDNNNVNGNIHVYVLHRNEVYDFLLLTFNVSASKTTLFYFLSNSISSLNVNTYLFFIQFAL